MKIVYYLKFFLVVTIAFLVSCKKDNSISPVSKSVSMPANAPITGDFYFSKYASSTEYIPEPQITYDVALYFFKPAADLTSTIMPIFTDVGDVFINGYEMNKYFYFDKFLNYAGVKDYPNNVLYLPLTLKNSGSQNNINFSGTFQCSEFTNLNNFDQLPKSYTLSAGFNYTLSGTNIPSSYRFYIGGYNQDTLSFDTILSGNVISLSGQLLQNRLDTGNHLISISFDNNFKYHISQNRVYRINYDTRYDLGFVKFY
jgi:hypothetical protein